MRNTNSRKFPNLSNKISVINLYNKEYGGPSYLHLQIFIFPIPSQVQAGISKKIFQNKLASLMMKKINNS